MAVTKPKLPKKSPPIKKSPKTDKTNETTGKTVVINEAPAGKASPTSTVGVPISGQKRRKKEAPQQKVNEQEIPWVKFMKKRQHTGEHLKPLATVWKGGGDIIMKQSKFLNHILIFNKRMDLAQWLTSKSVKCMMFLSDKTNKNLVRFKESLLDLKTN